MSTGQRGKPCSGASVETEAHGKHDFKAPHPLACSIRTLLTSGDHANLACCLHAHLGQASSSCRLLDQRLRKFSAASYCHWIELLKVDQT